LTMGVAVSRGKEKLKGGGGTKGVSGGGSTKGDTLKEGGLGSKQTTQSKSSVGKEGRKMTPRRKKPKRVREEPTKGTPDGLPELPPITKKTGESVGGNKTVRRSGLTKELPV